MPALSVPPCADPAAVHGRTRDPHPVTSSPAPPDAIAAVTGRIIRESREHQADGQPTRAQVIFDGQSADAPVLVADGYGITVSVSHGHLVVSDGMGRARRTRRIPRLPRTVQRVVIHGVTGTLSLEAIRWLSDTGIPWVQTGTDGRVLASSSSRRDDAGLIRAQVSAASDETGLAITRNLIAAKLRGQADVLRDFLPDDYASNYISGRADEVQAATSLQAIRSTEGLAARAYWDAWSGRVAVPWAPSDLVLVPEHWRGFGQRASLAHQHEGVHRGGSPNKDASDPVNAMLSYAYRVGEAEAVNACHGTGLHPAIGIMHADRFGRDSMALDLLEAIRPACDRFVLAMLAPDGLIPYGADGRPRYSDRRSFTETREGACRLLAPLTHELSARSAELAALVMPHAIGTVRMLTGPAPRVTTRRVAGQPSDHRSYPKARLADGVTAQDIIPDDLWEQIRGLVPEYRRQPGRPGRNRSLTGRELAAALVTRYVLGCPWAQVPADRETLEQRRREWEAAGAWQPVRTAVTGHGHLGTLTV